MKQKTRLLQINKEMSSLAFVMVHSLKAFCAIFTRLKESLEKRYTSEYEFQTKSIRHFDFYLGVFC